MLLENSNGDKKNRGPGPNLLRLSFLQEVTLAADECVQHPESLLGRDGVALEARQPPGHHLHAFDLAAGLVRQLLHLLPVAGFGSSLKRDPRLAKQHLCTFRHCR